VNRRRDHDGSPPDLSTREMKDRDVEGDISIRDALDAWPAGDQHRRPGARSGLGYRDTDAAWGRA